jgi:hypothetical protein
MGAGQRPEIHVDKSDILSDSMQLTWRTRRKFRHRSAIADNALPFTL